MMRPDATRAIELLRLVIDQQTDPNIQPDQPDHVVRSVRAQISLFRGLNSHEIAEIALVTTSFAATAMIELSKQVAETPHEVLDRLLASTKPDDEPGDV